MLGLTCYTAQYPASKYDPKGRAASRRLRTPWAPISICNHTKTVNKYSHIFLWLGINEEIFKQNHSGILITSSFINNFVYMYGNACTNNVCSC